MTDIALPSLRILIGKNDFAARAVIDKCFRTENKSRIKHLAEYPLRPFVIAFLCCIDHSRPIERKPHPFKLRSKPCDIHIGYFSRMNPCLDRIVLGRKPICVKADRKKHVIALHTPLSGNNFKPGIRLYMSDVHTCAARIRKFHKGIEFGFCMILRRLKNPFPFPFVLPFFI